MSHCLSIGDFRGLGLITELEKINLPFNSCPMTSFSLLKPKQNVLSELSCRMMREVEN
jgi:hypothetical protein